MRCEFVERFNQDSNGDDSGVTYEWKANCGAERG